ncbi:HAMP domain-containing sensor histidine kinase [Bengtsoniella intestinalis]|uniref:sensor histidine kinase n=1 Tax=Bengtsoniella intestinalis TaxID=3073143 RepID=UPI00391F60E0
MKTWKSNRFLKFCIYFVTILALMVSTASGAVLVLGYDNGTFTNGQYYGTDSYASLVSNTLWSYNARLENAKTWAQEEVLPEEEVSEESIQFSIYTQELELVTAEYIEDTLEDLQEQASLEATNFNIRITENATGEVLLSTFGDGLYWPMETAKYGNYTIEGALQSPTTVNDEFSGQELMYNQMRSLFPDIWVVFGIAVATALLGLCMVATVAGYRKGKEGITQGGLEKIPTDLWLILCAFVGIPAAIFAVSCGYNAWERQGDITYMVGMVAVVVACLLVLAELVAKTLETMVTRIKTHTFWRNTMVAWCLRTAYKGLATLPTIWRTAVIGLAVFAVNGFLGMCSTLNVFFWLIFAFYNLLMLLAVCAIAWQMKGLQAGAEQLATGKFKDKIDTSRMYFDCKKYGETLNTIGDGIGLAVDEKLKSQRMKTELISNVSHDIKTPLTSIVTCVELLQADHTDEEHAGYLELLQRQSMKMKKLVEDLVEASKASTGNLNVTMAETDLVEVVEQALAEYAGHFTAQTLTVVPQLPEECKAMADGKLMWRVLDNLLSNVCKYAMPSTRVYVTVAGGEHPEIAIKNISAEPLNMTSEELMERFVRGDSARSTEGSGLGLNIAQSLMQLQNGDLKLYIDGDFVKVQLYL